MFTIPEEIIGADVVNDSIVDAYKAQYVYALNQINGLRDPSFEDDATEVYSLERRLTMAAARDYNNSDPPELMTIERLQLEIDKINVTTPRAQVSLKFFATAHESLYET